MRYTPDIITTLGPNEIFVFGSNTSGRHGKGAAKTALKWGSVYGQGEGLYGRTYAFPTLGGSFKKLSLSKIYTGVRRLYKCARSNLELTFLVTKVGCGLAHFKMSEIAPCFFDRAIIPIPENIILPKEFWDYEHWNHDPEFDDPLS